MGLALSSSLLRPPQLGSSARQKKKERIRNTLEEEKSEPGVASRSCGSLGTVRECRDVRRNCGFLANPGESECCATPPSSWAVTAVTWAALHWWCR